MRKPKFAAFKQGTIPTIACFNLAATPLGVDLDKLIDAMQVYVEKYVAPVWGTPAKLVKSSGPIANAWSMVFLDNADVADALAYHDLNPDGLPLAKVFVETTLKNGDPVSVTASHELVEMLVDPAINLYTSGPNDKLMYFYECADPVESLSFSVNGIPMCDFVYPAYFESFRKPGSVQFDQMKQVTKPFQILKGGYQIIFKNGNSSEIYGSVAKAKLFKKEDRRGHRSNAHGKPLTRASAKAFQTLAARIERARVRPSSSPNPRKSAR
jgi:hypothetical protein